MQNLRFLYLEIIFTLCRILQWFAIGGEPEALFKCLARNKETL